MLKPTSGFSAESRRLVDTAVAPHRPQDANQTSSHCDGGNEFTASFDNGLTPASKRVIDRALGQHSPGCLDQQRSQVGITLLADGSDSASASGAVLFGYEPDVGFNLMRATKALGIVND
jgi:hypothetical protein